MRNLEGIVSDLSEYSTHAIKIEERLSIVQNGVSDLKDRLNNISSDIAKSQLSKSYNPQIISTVRNQIKDVTEHLELLETMVFEISINLIGEHKPTYKSIKENIQDYIEKRLDYDERNRAINDLLKKEGVSGDREYNKYREYYRERVRQTPPH